MRKLLIALFVLFVVFGKSQNATKPISKIKLIQSKYYKTGELGFFVGNDESNLYYCSIDKDKLVLRIFSANLELVKAKKVTLPARYKTLMISDVKKEGDELVIISMFHNKKIQNTIQFSESFDFNTIKSRDNFKKTKILNYLPDKDYNEIWRSYTNYNLGYNIDFIGNNIPGEWSMVVSRLKGDSIEGDKITLFFANSFSQLHKLDKVLVYNNGNNVAVATRYYESIKEYKDNDKVRYKAYNELVEKKVTKPNYNYLITFIDLNATTANAMIIKQLKVNITPNDFVKSLNISDIGHDSLLISGAYSSADILNTKGLYSLIVNVEKVDSVINIVDKYAFSNEFILKYRTDDEIVEMNLNKSRGVPYDFFNYNILSFDKVKDGYIATMEKSDNYITYLREQIGNSYTITTIFNRFYSDLFIMYISEDGLIQDVIKIPKRQVMASRINRFGNSSAVKIIGNKTLIIIPDFLKKYAGSSRRLISYIVDNDTGKIDNDIKITYENLEKANLTISPIWLDKYNMLSKASSRYGKKEKLVITNFKEFVLGE